jgi:hypothetical protein
MLSVDLSVAKMLKRSRTVSVIYKVSFSAERTVHVYFRNLVLWFFAGFSFIGIMHSPHQKPKHRL